MPRKPSKEKNPKVSASFKIDEDLLTEAKEECWRQKISFSSKMELLVKQWLDGIKKKHVPNGSKKP